RVPYPYNLRQPTDPLVARDLVLQHPASVIPHVWLVEAMGPRLDREVRAHELAIAAWLEPTNPAVLDLYAQSLVWTGHEREGHDEISRSVFTSPQLRTHFYLQWRLIPWLLPEERTAIEKGFREAVSRDFTGAVWSFGSYYEALQEYRKEAE